MRCRTSEPEPALRRIDDLGVATPLLADDEVTEMGWPVDADGIRRLMMWLHETYPGLPPVLVTENGRASDDTVEQGAVGDCDRIRYVDGHLRALAQAVEEGVDIRGYFVWTPARQLRVGGRLRQAVRAGARRLRDAGAAAEGELRLVPRPGREPHQLIGR